MENCVKKVLVRDSTLTCGEKREVRASSRSDYQTVSVDKAISQKVTAAQQKPLKI